MNLIDLRELDQQQAYGLAEAAQIADDWTACQHCAGGAQ